MQIAEAAPPLQSGGRFREPGENFGMTSPASSIRGPRSRAQRIVPTCYRRHRCTRDMVNTGGITAEHRLRTQDDRSRGRAPPLQEGD